MISGHRASKVAASEACPAAPAAAFHGRVAVLVVSCDNYGDLWSPFFTAFERFWPDCPCKVYLLANHRDYHRPGVHLLQVGEDRSWSDNLLAALERMEEEYVFLFIEDLLLVDRVDTAKVCRIFEWMLDEKPNYVRFKPSPRPDKPHNGDIGIVSKGTIYRTSTVLAAWKKETLRTLLETGESAWDFELFGTERSNRYDGFYSTWRLHFPIVNSVIKGKWEPRAVNKLAAADIDIDLATRPVMSGAEQLSLRLKEARARLLRMLPAKYRRATKRLIAGGKHNYEPAGK